MDFFYCKFVEGQNRFQKWDLPPAMISFFLLFLMMNPSTAEAQTSKLQVGDRIRLTAPVVDSKKIKGTVKEMDESVIVLSVNGSSYYISESLIQNLEISVGKKRVVGRGLVMGTVSGTILLGILSSFINSACRFSEDCILANINGDVFLKGAIAGLVIGGAAGAIAGFFIKTDRWERVPVSVAMDLAPVSSYINPQTVEPKISVRFSLR